MAARDLQSFLLLGLTATGNEAVPCLLAQGLQPTPPVIPPPPTKIFAPIRTTAPPRIGCANDRCPPYFVAGASYTAICPSTGNQATVSVQEISYVSEEHARSVALAKARCQAEAKLAACYPFCSTKTVHGSCGDVATVKACACTQIAADELAVTIASTVAEYRCAHSGATPALPPGASLLA